jgi:hypothetical protein
VKIRATVIKTETLNLQKIRTEHHIPCLLLNERKINNGAIVYFHANAEDVGMTKGFGKLISKELNVYIKNYIIFLDGFFFRRIPWIWYLLGNLHERRSN